MRKLFFAIIVLTAASVSAQDMTVAVGTTKTLTAAERTLNLHKLTLGDNSTVIIPASLDGWTVEADDVSIGANVKIVGRGLNGIAGTHGLNATHASQTCIAGTAGQNAVAGASGTAGKKVELKLRIRNLGSLDVNVGGGHGGMGGRGGSGGNGGSAKCAPNSCKGGVGGKGGAGGRGGNGGAGGAVKIEYRKLGNVNIDATKFIVTNTGGNGGAGSIGGKGGMGGAAKDCVFGMADQAAGQNGVPGVMGANGISGAAGTKVITTY